MRKTVGGVKREIERIDLLSRQLGKSDFMAGAILGLQWAIQDGVKAPSYTIEYLHNLRSVQE